MGPILETELPTCESTAVGCKRCRLPTPTPPIRGEPHVFCSLGCREARRCFGERVLPGETVDPAHAEKAAEE